MVACGWLAVVFGGMAVLVDYGARPSVPASAPSRWPVASRIERAPALPTLVMLVHPLCPCSRASVAELARLMTVLHDKIKVDVLLFEPTAADGQWQASDLRAAVAAIPGVRMFVDDDGREARLFGGFTSGQTFLYDAEGELRFAGGITDARGHEGDNYGVDAIAAAVLNPRRAVATTPVFGCALSAPPTGIAAGGRS